MPSHYEVLGVAATASPEEVRRAYHGRARRLHPDRQAGSAPADAALNARGMQDVNEAWWVLRDQTRRSAYDRQLLRVRSPQPGGGRGRQGPQVDGGNDPDDVAFPSRPVEPGDIGITFVRSLPWLAVAVVLGAIFVFTAFAGADRSERATLASLVGSCVQLQSGVEPDAVPCDAPNDGRVDLVVPELSQCPSGSVGRSVPGEGRWLCLRDADEPAR